MTNSVCIVDYPNKPFVEQVGDGFRKMAGYFLSMRKITVVNSSVVRDERVCKGVKSVKESRLLSLPARALDSIGKLFCQFSETNAAKLNCKKIVDKHHARQFVPQKLNFDNFSLDESHEKLTKLYSDIVSQIKSADDWSKPRIIKKIDMFMELSYREVRYLLFKASQDAKGAPEQIAKVLANQREYPYCRPFFYHSFVSMYHLVRSRYYSLEFANKDEALEYYKKERPNYVEFFKNNAESLQDPVTGKYYDNRSAHFIDSKYQEPFFNPKKPEYKWRLLYNSVREEMKKMGIKSAMKTIDNRFLRWTNPDHAYKPTSKNGLVELYFEADRKPT